MKLFRKSIIKRAVAIVLICFAANSLFASEKMVFEMYLMGKNIGNLTVTHSILEDGSDHYFLTTKAKAKILWVEREQTTRYEIVYKNGMLLRSSYAYIENTGNNILCDIKLNNGNYEVKRNGKTFTVTGKPTHSIISVYFNEPKNLKKIFYEPDAVFAEIKQLEDHSYEFNSPDGTRNIYFYTNGKLSGMEFRQSLFTVKAKRVQ